jgi:hypothetical protein
MAVKITDTVETFKALSAGNAGGTALKLGIEAEYGGAKTLVSVLRSYTAFRPDHAPLILAYVANVTAALRSRDAGQTIAPKPVTKDRVRELRRIIELQEWKACDQYFDAFALMGLPQRSIAVIATHIVNKVAKDAPMLPIADMEKIVADAQPVKGGKGAAKGAADTATATNKGAADTATATATPATVLAAAPSISNATAIVTGLQEKVTALRAVFATSDGVAFLDSVNAALASFLPYANAAAAAAEKAAAAVAADLAVAVPPAPVALVVPVPVAPVAPVHSPEERLAIAKAEYDKAMAALAGVPAPVVPAPVVPVAPVAPVATTIEDAAMAAALLALPLPKKAKGASKG